jgi:hypothetical protein
VEAGRAAASAVLGREEGEGALLSWEEVEALARTGLVDFQSHTKRHARVHTAPQLAGFVTPASRRGYDAFDQPLLWDGERDLVGEEAPLGAPLFRSAPRTSEEARFYEDPEVRADCVAAVAASGGTLFKRPTGRQLRRLRRSASRAWKAAVRAAAIRRELGRAPHHRRAHWPPSSTSATPGTAGLKRGGRRRWLRDRVLRQVDNVPVTLPGGDRLAIARLGEDYLELLPGKGRATLAGVLRRKWSRRFGSARG